MADFIILALLGAAVVAAVVSIIKQKKSGGCSCGCQSCAMKDSCHKK